MGTWIYLQLEIYTYNGLEMKLVNTSLIQPYNIVGQGREKVLELLIRNKYIQIDTDSNTKCFEFQFRAYQDRICKLENESELQKVVC